VSKKSIVVVGAGILGLWQAYVLARAGNRVRLVEESTEPFARSSSRWAAAMIAPECEAEGAPPIVRDLGHEGLALWRAMYPGLVANGTLVVAPARDAADLARFARMTDQHEIADADMCELLGDVRISASETHQADCHLRQPLFALGA